MNAPTTTTEQRLATVLVHDSHVRTTPRDTTLSDVLDKLCEGYSGYYKSHGRGYLVFGVPMYILQGLLYVSYAAKRRGGVFVVPSVFSRVKSNTGLRTGGV